MSQATFNEMALELVRIYFACHPAKLPEDSDKAFSEMVRLHAHFKEKLIEQGIKKNNDFFSDRL